MNEVKKIDELKDLECVSCCNLKEETITSFDHYIEFQNCTFEKIIFDGNFEGIRFQNVKFKECCFSNSNFYGSSFINVIFESCDLIGIDMSGSTCIDVSILSSKSNYSNFNDSIMKHVKLMESDFSEASLSRVKLEQVILKNNRFIKADFHNTSLKSIDFRTNEMEGIFVNLADLKGAIVTPNQAVCFFPLLGLTIKEENE